MVLFHIVEGDAMVIKEIQFKTHLNYQIQASSNEKDEATFTVSDVENINLRKCRFDDFKNALIYIRDNNPEISFSDAVIDTVKPSGFSEDKIYNFIELIEFAKHTAINIGNMALFIELQKLARAADTFTLEVRHKITRKPTNIIPFEDYNDYEIKEPPVTTDELGSCVIGGGNDEPVKITATFHESATPVTPIVSIRVFSLATNSYLPNVDIINLDTIFKPNATLMEAFAYLSYQDYQKHTFNHSFDQLLANGVVSVNNLEDMYSKHYDLNLADN